MHPAYPQRKLRKVMPTGCQGLENLPVTRTQPLEPLKLHKSLAWLCEPENLPPSGNFIHRLIPGSPAHSSAASQPHPFLLFSCFPNGNTYNTKASPFPYFKRLGCKERKTGFVCHNDIFPDGKPTCNTGKCLTKPWLTRSPHFTDNSQI